MLSAEIAGGFGSHKERTRGASDMHCLIDSSIKRRERLVYLAGDRTAQDLAERLVALVPRRYRWRTAGLTPFEFGNALRCRDDVGT